MISDQGKRLPPEGEHSGAGNGSPQGRDYYADLFEFAPVAFLALEGNGTVLQSNRAAETLLGLSRDALRGSQLCRLCVSNDQKSFHRHCEQALTHNGTQSCELQIVKPDGTTLDVRLDTAVGQRGVGGGEELCMVLSDISRQKHIEDCARKHLEALAHFGRVSTLGELASGLAHELSQPLTALTLQADAAEHMLATLSTETTARLAISLREICQQADRANKIIGLLRRLVERNERRRSAFDINDLVRDVVTLVAAELRQEEIALPLQLAADMSLILADRARIEQVLINLVQNSVEITSGGYRPRS
jgi:two-component system sensor kinase FixL